MDAVKKSWIHRCRPIIGLDGCFLKGFCKGELLIAIGRDGNNQMFPIAWAQVEVENTSSWTWFVEILASDLGYSQGHGLTIISDQQKGLMEAVHQVLPLEEHKNCASHIYANFRKSFPGAQWKSYFWAAAKCGTQQVFDKKIVELEKLNGSAAKYIKDSNPKSWSRAFFPFTACCENVDNNMCEAFNGTIIEARPKPIINMFEDIRLYIVSRMLRKIEDMKKWEGNICPRIRQRLEKNMEACFQWVVYYVGNDKYEIRREASGYIVDLKAKECTCRHWGLSGIPCPHAIGAIMHVNDDVEKYVAEWYTVETYKKTYDFNINPLNGEDMWPHCTIEPILPPIERRMPGRPKKERRKEMHEEKKGGNPRVSKEGGKVHCSLSKAEGHNKKTCKAMGHINTLESSMGQGSGTVTLESTVSQGSGTVTQSSQEQVTAEYAFSRGKTPFISSQGSGTIPQASYDQVSAESVANKGKTPMARPKLPVKRKAVVPEGIGLFVNPETGASVWKPTLKKRNKNAAQEFSRMSSTVPATKNTRATVPKSAPHAHRPITRSKQSLAEKPATRSTSKPQKRWI